MSKNNLKQINFWIQAELHKSVKVLAAQRGISMNLWIMRAIYRRLSEEQDVKDS